VPLGSGVRISDGWELTGLSLPATGLVRARGGTTCGQRNGSAGLVEAVAALAFPESASERWRQTYFGSPENTGAAADLSDPDRDGIVNLVEFATGSHPLAATPDPVQLVEHGSVLEFTCRRRKAAMEDVTMAPEWSQSLSGMWSRDDSAPAVLNDDGVLEQLQYRLPSGPEGMRFVRLRITRR
jgi:hypothetical protein